MDEKQVNFFLGILEDYSNRYIAFASFFIASIFGNYSLLSFSKKDYFVLFILVYIFLYGMGVFSILNTLRYAKLTNQITQEILKDDIYRDVWDSTFRDVYKQFPFKHLHKIDKFLQIYPVNSSVFLIIHFFIMWFPFYYSFCL